ncbi:universal stress protein [Kribbella koreensis]|uniref:Universal stress protein n=2 Tax=Kribbella TaxID=182639 RepID=A0ABP6VY15_9ACTN
MTDKIIVGVDAAWRRSGALDWAVHEAVRRRVPLRAVHVADERTRHAYAAPVRIEGQVIIPAVIPEADNRLADEVEEYLVAADRSLDLAADVVVGAPDKRLAELSTDAGLTVVGRRGVGGFARLLIGSTSEYVANHGDGPIVVVPEGWKRVQHVHAPVIVGLDGYEDDGVALEFACEMAVRDAAPLWMVLAWDVPTPYSWNAATAGAVREDWKRLARERLDTVAEQWQHKYPDLKVVRRLVQAHAAAALLETAESAGAQLIVIGGRRHRLPGLMLGSVARGVLHHATVPVAVVHDSRPES